MTMSEGNGLSMCTCLGVNFIILRLVGIISWPWKWVLAPFLLGFAIDFIEAMIYSVKTKHKDRRNGT